MRIVIAITKSFFEFMVGMPIGGLIVDIWSAQVQGPALNAVNLFGRCLRLLKQAI